MKEEEEEDRSGEGEGCLCCEGVEDRIRYIHDVLLCKILKSNVECLHDAVRRKRWEDYRGGMSGEKKKERQMD